MCSDFTKIVLSAVVCLTFVSLANGAYDTNKSYNAGEGLCSLQQSQNDCLDAARNSAGFGAGGWRRHNGNDKYTDDIITDVQKILKKNFNCVGAELGGLKTEVLEVFTQVVSGINVCMSIDIMTKCGVNNTKPCAPKMRQCSILAYKPPSKDPVQESNISLFNCQI